MAASARILRSVMVAECVCVAVLIGLTGADPCVNAFSGFPCCSVSVVVLVVCLASSGVCSVVFFGVAALV